jgi:hypothetical protein
MHRSSPDQPRHPTEDTSPRQSGPEMPRCRSGHPDCRVAPRHHLLPSLPHCPRQPARRRTLRCVPARWLRGWGCRSGSRLCAGMAVRGCSVVRIRRGTWNRRGEGMGRCTALHGRASRARPLAVLCSALSRRLAAAQLGDCFRDGLVFLLGGERLPAAGVLPQLGHPPQQHDDSDHASQPA